MVVQSGKSLPLISSSLGVVGEEAALYGYFRGLVPVEEGGVDFHALNSP